MLLLYDLRQKCAQFISYIFLISCHSCKFNFYTKKRSRIYKKTQNFSKLPELERPRIGPDVIQIHMKPGSQDGPTEEDGGL